MSSFAALPVEEVVSVDTPAVSPAVSPAVNPVNDVNFPRLNQLNRQTFAAAFTALGENESESTNESTASTTPASNALSGWNEVVGGRVRPVADAQSASQAVPSQSTSRAAPTDALAQLSTIFNVAPKRSEGEQMSDKIANAVAGAKEKLANLKSIQDDLRQKIEQIRAANLSPKQLEKIIAEVSNLLLKVGIESIEEIISLLNGPSTTAPTATVRPAPVGRPIAATPNLHVRRFINPDGSPTIEFDAYLFAAIAKSWKDEISIESAIQNALDEIEEYHTRESQFHKHLSGIIEGTVREAHDRDPRYNVSVGQKITHTHGANLTEKAGSATIRATVCGNFPTYGSKEGGHASNLVHSIKSMLNTFGNVSTDKSATDAEFQKLRVVLFFILVNELTKYYSRSYALSLILLDRQMIAAVFRRCDKTEMVIGPETTIDKEESIRRFAIMVIITTGIAAGESTVYNQALHFASVDRRSK
jgi:hypothetical protein